MSLKSFLRRSVILPSLLGFCTALVLAKLFGLEPGALVPLGIAFLAGYIVGDVLL